MNEQFQISFDDVGVESPSNRPPGSDHTAHVPSVLGLAYLPRFLSDSAQAALWDRIEGLPWRDDLERRVQHYGWRYDYRARTVARDMHIGPLPEWLRQIARRLYAETSVFDCEPDQAIVNEYLPGQGIARHVDRQCFGPAVATISLGDAWLMDLRPLRGTKGVAEQILLEPGSALVLTDAARWRWLHGIAPRKYERANGGKRPRKRRISVTFRTVVLSGDDAPGRAIPARGSPAGRPPASGSGSPASAGDGRPTARPGSAGETGS